MFYSAEDSICSNPKVFADPSTVLPPPSGGTDKTDGSPDGDPSVSSVSDPGGTFPLAGAGVEVPIGAGADVGAAEDEWGEA